MFSRAQGNFKNFGSLAMIQLASYVAPLLLLPYLSRVLGIDLFGTVFFGISFVTISCVLIDFGFELYAPLKIAPRRDDFHYVNQLSGAIFGAKLCLFLVAAIITLIFAMFTDRFEGYFISLFIFPMFWFTIQPNWFFQSLEKTQEIVLYFIISRLSYVGLVIAFVNAPKDYTKVIICLGVCYSVNAALSLRKMLKLGFRPVFPSFLGVRRVIWASTGYFFARASSSIYSAGGIVFLGLVSTTTQVAYFSSAEQIFRGLQGLFTPVSQALYPYMVRERNKKIFVLVLCLATFICSFGALLLAYLSEPIIELIFGLDFLLGVTTLITFLGILAINLPSTLIGYPFLGAFGHSNYVNMTVILAGVIQIFFLLLLFIFDWTTAFHVSLSILFAELLILLLRGLKSSMILKSQKVI